MRKVICRRSGDEGDVTVNDDGSITINADHKLHIYETEVDGETDYSLEFKSYTFMTIMTSSTPFPADTLIFLRHTNPLT